MKFGKLNGKPIPIFPSYERPDGPIRNKEPNPKKRLPPGQQYIAHTGRRARLRNLRNLCRPILSSKEPEVQEAVQKARDFIAENGSGPFMEYGVLMILHTAKEIAESAEGVSIADSINYVVSISHTSKESEMPQVEEVPKDAAIVRVSDEEVDEDMDDVEEDEDDDLEDDDIEEDGDDKDEDE